MKKQRDIYRNLSIVVILVAGLGILGIYLWNKPLGPQLLLSTWNAERTAGRSELSQPAGAAGEAVSQPTLAAGEEAENKFNSQVLPKGEALCGGPEVMTILLIGSDYRGEGYLYGLADAIRIVRIDFTTPAVSVLDFPRDLWVEIPGVADHYGLTHGKLNQAYFYGTTGMGYYDGPGEGPGLLARTLDLNFNLLVDYYLTIRMETLIEAVDAVGGVEITFEEGADLNAVVGPTYEQLLFSAGTYHFDGELANHLVRSRKPSTFQRTRYQNMLIFALREKVLSPEMRSKLPGLVASFIGDVQTDLSLSEINKLVCVAQAIPVENIHIVSFPEQLFTGGRIYDPYRDVNTYIDKADYEVLRAYVAQFMAGSWPAP